MITYRVDQELIYLASKSCIESEIEHGTIVYADKY